MEEPKTPEAAAPAPPPVRSKKRQARKKKVSLKDVAIPWERLPAETPLAYGGFVVFRRMGRTRSLRKLTDLVKEGRLEPEDAANIQTKSLSQIGGWSSKYEWIERARLYDEWLDRQLETADLEESLKVRRAHLNLARVIRGKVSRRFANLSEDELNRASLPVLVQVGQFATGLENTHYQFNTQRLQLEPGPGNSSVEVTTTKRIPTSELSDAELETVIAIRRRVDAADRDGSDPGAVPA